MPTPTPFDPSVNLISSEINSNQEEVQISSSSSSSVSEGAPSGHLMQLVGVKDFGKHFFATNLCVAFKNKRLISCFASHKDKNILQYL